MFPSVGQTSTLQRKQWNSLVYWKAFYHTKKICRQQDKQNGCWLHYTAILWMAKSLSILQPWLSSTFASMSVVWTQTNTQIWSTKSCFDHRFHFKNTKLIPTFVSSSHVAIGNFAPTNLRLFSNVRTYWFQYDGLIQQTSRVIFISARFSCIYWTIPTLFLGAFVSNNFPYAAVSNRSYYNTTVRMVVPSTRE